MTTRFPQRSLSSATEAGSTPAEVLDDVKGGARTPMKPVCKRLRTKMYYVMGRDHVDLQVASPTAQYWCALTATVLGPDDVYCAPGVCRPGRACFDPE